MAVYSYEAVNDSGKVFKSIYEADNREDVLEMLREKGLYPIKVDETLNREINFLFSPEQIKTRDLAFFCRQISALLDAGIPIADALQIISQQIINKKLRVVISEIAEEVLTGVPFSEAMQKQKIFPELLVQMISSGEASGTLNNVMRRMAEDYEKEYGLKKKISGAMIYPILIMVVAVVAVVFVLTSVMPRFVEMFASANLKLPIATQILLNISEFLQHYCLYLFIALVLLIFAVIKYSHTSHGRFWFDIFKLNIPIIGKIYKKLISARFTRTLSSLLKSGIPLIQSLDYVASVVGNKVVKGKVLKIKEEIEKGANLTESVRKADFFEPVVIHMVKIGEDSGQLDEVMENTSQIYDQEVESAVQGISSIIEPLMIIFMAVIVGALVLSIVSPMFDMAQTMDM